MKFALLAAAVLTASTPAAADTVREYLIECRGTPQFPAEAEFWTPTSVYLPGARVTINETRGWLNRAQNYLFVDLVRDGSRQRQRIVRPAPGRTSTWATSSSTASRRWWRARIPQWSRSAWRSTAPRTSTACSATGSSIRCVTTTASWCACTAASSSSRSGAIIPTRSGAAAAPAAPDRVARSSIRA